MNTTVLKNNVRYALTAALSILVTFCVIYLLVEPRVGRAVSAVGVPFSIRQEIGGEISFLTQAANVTMVGTLNGLTGGTATGTTQAVVRTNNFNGYYMEIAFADSDSDGVIMRRDLGGAQSASIRNYATSSDPVVEPSFGFSVASSASMFAYSVSASNTDDIDASFLNDGADCNVGSGVQENVCWMSPSTAGFRIIERGSSAPQGATTTISFRVYIPLNPNPGVETGFYTATATLTAFNII